jgi:hypothetical protein
VYLPLETHYGNHTKDIEKIKKSLRSYTNLSIWSYFLLTFCIKSLINVVYLENKKCKMLKRKYSEFTVGQKHLDKNR